MLMQGSMVLLLLLLLCLQWLCVGYMSKLSAPPLLSILIPLPFWFKLGVSIRVV